LTNGEVRGWNFCQCQCYKAGFYLTRPSGLGASYHAFPAWATVTIVLGSVLILVVGAVAALFVTYRQRNGGRAQLISTQQQTLLQNGGVRARCASALLCIRPALIAAP
jgi:hypothetical protein